MDWRGSSTCATHPMARGKASTPTSVWRTGLTKVVQIFKHHISVVEGHLKMLEMIKKHTVPETGNWRQICPMVARSHEMLRMVKDAIRSFVCT